MCPRYHIITVMLVRGILQRSFARVNAVVMEDLLVTEANSVLDLVDNRLRGTTVDLLILLTAGLVEGFLSGRLVGVRLGASGNA